MEGVRDEEESACFEGVCWHVLATSQVGHGS
jgi:hypothetical protein